MKKNIKACAMLCYAMLCYAMLSSAMGAAGLQFTTTECKRCYK